MSTTSRNLRDSRLPVACFFALLAVFLMPSIIAQADEAPATRPVSVEVLPEDGCPVSITSARSELELDPFGVPRASRLFIDYKNRGGKNITAVLFRIRNTDERGADRGTYQAAHQATLPPDGASSEKWRHPKVDPRVTATKVRVLMTRFADGTSWSSAKAGQIVGIPETASGQASSDLPKGGEAAAQLGAGSQAVGGAPAAQEAAPAAQEAAPAAQEAAPADQFAPGN